MDYRSKIEGLWGYTLMKKGNSPFFYGIKSAYFNKIIIGVFFFFGGIE